MDSLTIKNKISVSVHKVDPNAEVYLFGSRARGTNSIKSDWDILILIDELKVTNDIEDKFRDDLYDIELASGQIISTLIYPKSYWKSNLSYSPLYQNIQKDGILL